MEANPYAAPVAEVKDETTLDGAELEARKAPRGTRLGAAMIDVVLMTVVLIAPVMIMGAQAGTASKTTTGLVGLFMIVGTLALIIVNCVFLHRNAQTIGKRMLGIKVVRTDGSRIGLGRIFGLRFLPVTLLGAIPFVGRLSGLIDALLIFGSERRCLHDLIADTIVIRAD
jgi:uncharacterized RDD family membrane protein YckC